MIVTDILFPRRQVLPIPLRTVHHSVKLVSLVQNVAGKCITPIGNFRLFTLNRV